MQALCDKAPIKTLDTESELPWQAILCADCLQCDQAVHVLMERGLLEPHIWTPCGLDSMCLVSWLILICILFHQQLVM